jgi:hypothetical protein
MNGQAHNVSIVLAEGLDKAVQFGLEGLERGGIRHHEGVLREAAELVQILAGVTD